MLIRGIALYLHQQGAGKLDETGNTGNIFLFHIPAIPESLIALIPLAGLPSSGTLAYDMPGFQVRIRGTQDPRSAYTKAEQIYALLHGLHETTLPDGTWLLKCLSKSSSPIPLGTDNNGRFEFVLSFDTEILNSTVNRED